MGKDFYMGTDGEIATGSANFSAKISATPTDYGLVAAQATAYATVNTAYQTVYTAAINPDTRTKPVIAAKNNARMAVKVMASDLAKIINGTPTVTDDQKLELGLNVRKTPTPHPVPRVRPFMKVGAVNGNTLNVNIYSDSETKRAKPPGVISAYVYTFVGATYPSDPTTWQFHGAATKSAFQITMPDTVAGGARIWICAAWCNRRGETGPTSVPVSTFVQGGMSMAA